MNKENSSNLDRIILKFYKKILEHLRTKILNHVARKYTKEMIFSKSD